MGQALATRNSPGAVTLSLPDSVQRSLTAMTVGYRETDKGRAPWPKIARSLAPSSTDRQAIARKIDDLQALEGRRDVDYSMAKVADLLLALTVGQGMTEGTAKAKARGYMVALDDLPSWAVAEACRRWLRGEAGDHNYNFPPLPPILREVAQHCANVLALERVQLQRLLEADVIEDPREFTDEERGENLQRLAVVLHRITDKPVRAEDARPCDSEAAE